MAVEADCAKTEPADTIAADKRSARRHQKAAEQCNDKIMEKAYRNQAGGGTLFLRRNPAAAPLRCDWP